MKIFRFLIFLIITSINVYSQNNYEVYWQRALDFHQKGDYLNCALQIVNIDTSSQTCEMIELRGDCFHKLGYYESGIKFLEKAKLKCKLKFESYVNLGDCYFKNSNLDSALANFNYALKLNANNPELNFNLGLCSYVMSDFDNAKYFLKQSIKLNDEDLDSYDLLMQIYNESNHIDSTLILIGELKNHKDKARIKLMEAYAYAYKNDYKKSLELINQVLKMDSLDYQTESNAYLNRYEIYYELGDKESACEEYIKIIGLYPDIEINNYFDCKK